MLDQAVVPVLSGLGSLSSQFVLERIGVGSRYEVQIRRSDTGRTPELCVVAVPQSPQEKGDVQRKQAMRSP